LRDQFEAGKKRGKGRKEGKAKEGNERGVIKKP